MKSVLLFPAALRITAVFLLSTTSLTAQTVAAPSPVDPKPSKSPTPTMELPPALTGGPTLRLQLKSEPVPDALDELQRALQGAKLPELNVLIDPAVKEMTIPDLTLRNVTGTDALRLIAASANCDIETITGDNARTIGFRIVAQRAPMEGNWKAGLFGGVPSANSFQGLKQTQVPRNPQVAGDKPSRSNTISNSYRAPTTTPPLAREVPVPTEVIGFTSSANPRSAVRVYPLAGITPATPYTDIEETLRGLFKLEGIPEDAGELALHKRTNVLVVKGDNIVHELVSQLLAALQKNVAATTAPASSASSEAPREFLGRIAADAERKQNERAHGQAEEADAKVKEAARELERRKIDESKAR